MHDSVREGIKCPAAITIGMPQIHRRSEVGSPILQEERIHPLLTSCTVPHRQRARKRASIQYVIPIYDRVPVYAPAILVKARATGKVAVAHSDAVGGGKLPFVQ